MRPRVALRPIKTKLDSHTILPYVSLATATNTLTNNQLVDPDARTQ